MLVFAQFHLSGLEEWMEEQKRLFNRKGVIPLSQHTARLRAPPQTHPGAPREEQPHAYPPPGSVTDPISHGPSRSKFSPFV